MDSYRAIIVEDEPHTGRYIRTLVENTALFTVDGIFESAEEALEYEALEEIHLVITDIKMEGETGLKMLKKIAVRNPKAVSVIISGYSTFAYAQEAIERNVSRYLLKPIKKEELNEALLDIYDKLSDIQEQADQEFLMRLTKESLSFFTNTSENCGDFLQGLYVQGSFDVQKMLLRLRRIFRKTKRELFYYLYREGFLVLEYSGCEKGKLSDLLLRVMTAILSWEKNSEETCLIVYTEKSVREKDFRSEIRRIYRFHQKYLVLGRVGCKPYRREETENLTAVKQDEPRLEEIRKALAAGDMLMFHTQYGNLFDAWEKRKENVLTMREELFRITAMMRGTLADGQDTLQVMNSLLQHICKASGYAAAKRDTMEIFSGEWAEERGIDCQRQSEKTFHEILKYLHEHISENYSLLEIADIFHISQPYVSKLFRLYAKMSYKDYITKEKINLSVRMMNANPHYRVKDIAEKLGYDQIYFSTVFHRVTGEYPTKYREKLMEKTESQKKNEE